MMSIPYKTEYIFEFIAMSNNFQQSLNGWVLDTGHFLLKKLKAIN